MSPWIARLRRWVYLLFVGQFRGEQTIDIFDHRGIYQLESGTTNGMNLRIWWRRS